MAAPMKKKKANDTSKRYSEAEKKRIIAFVEAYNKKHGRGGVSAAHAKFGVSTYTYYLWRPNPSQGSVLAVRQIKKYLSSIRKNIDKVLARL